MAVICLLVAFGAGFAVAALVQPRSVTKLQVVHVNRSTDLPVGCLRAMAVIQHLQGLMSRSRLVIMQAEFAADAAACRIPQPCVQAMAIGGNLIENTQTTRTQALAILHSYQRAARDCR